MIASCTKVFEVWPALTDDSNEARVWIKAAELRTQLDGRRGVVRIRNGSQCVYGEALYADEYYLEQPHCGLDVSREDLIFLNGWQRRVLAIKRGDGITPPSDALARVPLTVEMEAFPRSVWWQLVLCTRHPQLVVLVATVLGLIGGGLGLIGVGLGMIPLQETLPVALRPIVAPASWLLLAIGALTVVWSIALLFQRVIK